MAMTQGLNNKPHVEACESALSRRHLLRHREKDEDKHGNATRATKSLAPKKKKKPPLRTQKASILLELLF